MPDICYIGMLYLLIGSFVPPDEQTKPRLTACAGDCPAHRLVGEVKQKQVPDCLEPVCIFRAENITALTPLR